MLACKNMVVAGVQCVGRGKKTWGECVKDGMKLQYSAICGETSYMGQASNPSLM